MTTIALSRTTTLPRGSASHNKFDPRSFFARAWRNYITRRQLSDLDDRMLQDLGISRAQAQFEADKPLWR